MQRHITSAMTLVEFLSSLIIVVVLIGIAIPTYYHYRHKAFYSEIVSMAEEYQSPVEDCIKQHPQEFSACSAGKNTIPDNMTDGPGQVESVTVENGVITVTPKPHHGIKATDTYILTPKVSNDKITWKASGGGCKSGFAQGC